MILTSTAIKETLLDIAQPITVTEAQLVKVNNEYIILNNVRVTLPNSSTTTLKNGDFIKFNKLLTVTPTIYCAVNTISTVNGEDNEILYNIDTSIILVFNSSSNKWEIS
jgi:hypothetical protein